MRLTLPCLRCVAALALAYPAIAHAKLGDTETESQKRFGRNFVALTPIPNTDFGRRYHVQQGFYVHSYFRSGRVVEEHYYGDLPLEDGRAPERIAKGVRTKQAPESQWVMTPKGTGYITRDGRFYFLADTNPEESPGSRYRFIVRDTWGLYGFTPPPPTGQRASAPTASNQPSEGYRLTATYWQNAEKFGNSIHATGRGIAVNISGETIRLQPGERLHVISTDPDRGTLLVNREMYNSLAVVTLDGVELKN